MHKKTQVTRVGVERIVGQRQPINFEQARIIIIMNEKELRTQMVENAKQAGYYKGLLEGLMCQAINMGEYYSISTEVFDKVETALEKFDEPRV